MKSIAEGRKGPAVVMITQRLLTPRDARRLQAPFGQSFQPLSLRIVFFLCPVHALIRKKRVKVFRQSGDLRRFKLEWYGRSCNNL